MIIVPIIAIVVVKKEELLLMLINRGISLESKVRETYKSEENKKEKESCKCSNKG